MKRLVRKVREAIPRSPDEPAKKWFSFFIYASIFLMLLMALGGVGAFMLAIRAPEEVLVPAVEGLELEDALLALQKYKLYPYVQLRYSSDPTTKGKVVAQSPPPGSLMKVGKEVTLVVSRGAVVEEVQDYRGKLVEEVSLELRSLFAPYEPLITIKQPLIYVYSDKPVGTVLEQKPEPGTRITGPVELELVVSRGPAPQRVTVPQLVGKLPDEALQILASLALPFTFSPVEEEDGPSDPGVIREQLPEAGTRVAPGTRVELKYVPYRNTRTAIAGLFDYALPTYPVPVDLSVEVIVPGGEREVLFSMKHPGGRLSFPYLLPANAEIVVKVYNREIIHHLVTQPQ
ncbi:PASTA domain-containing protein [Spirochaeta thermophila]|nr:PASTA domain-containing protein [Spirochaeta thermophila]